MLEDTVRQLVPQTAVNEFLDTTIAVLGLIVHRMNLFSLKLCKLMFDNLWTGVDWTRAQIGR